MSAVLLTWAGVKVARAHEGYRVRYERDQATLASVAEWRRRTPPAAAAESIAWRRTEMELRSLGVIGDERLSLVQQVSRAAEAAGLREVRVFIGEADTTRAAERLSTEGVRRRSTSFGLMVECRGNLSQVATFLGELPLAVAPTTLDLVRQDGRARHRISLAVFELQVSNGSATISTRLERGASSGVSGDRVRG